VDENEELPVYENFVWASLGQIKELLTYPNVVNMDTRTVISCIQYGNYSEKDLQLLSVFRLDTNLGHSDSFLYSVLSSDNHYNTMNSIIRWLTSLKFKYELNVDKIGLSEMNNWIYDGNVIEHKDKKYFSVIGVDVSIGNREVTHWDQPMVKAAQEGIMGFLVKKINGIYHFLVQAKLECGNFDAAAFFISDVRMIEKVMDDDIYATCLPYIEADWTKSEAFDIMDMDKEVYKNSFQYQASFMAFRKSMRSIMFVEEWLNNCCNPDLINPAQNIGKQIETFQNHRMDQSCFSLLCKKYNVSPHKDPTQFGIWGYPEVRGARYVGVKMKNEYPIVIVLHRLKDFGLRNKLRLVKRTMCLISKNIIKNIRRKRC
jgi:hypothetical protein